MSGSRTAAGLKRGEQMTSGAPRSAEVEIIATYDLVNINRTKLENLIHRVFGPARLDVEIKDRFGKPVIPREWFLVPLFVIDEAVERIKDGTIGDVVYDPQQARLVEDSSDLTK
ncbi:MAG: GIY-YIG nuclease family protein [Hyphomicrobiaceae bacterium]